MKCAILSLLLAVAACNAETPEVTAGKKCSLAHCAAAQSACSADSTCLAEIMTGGSAGSALKNCTTGDEFVTCYEAAYLSELFLAGYPGLKEQQAAGAKCSDLHCKDAQTACFVDKTGCNLEISTGGSASSALKNCTTGEQFTKCVANELATTAPTSAPTPAPSDEDCKLTQDCYTTACKVQEGSKPKMMTTGEFKDCAKPTVAACAASFPNSPCGTKPAKETTAPTPAPTQAPKTKTKKDQVSAMIVTMRGLMSGNAMSQETLDLLDVGFDKLIATEDMNGTQAILEKGMAMFISGKYKTMNDVVKDKEFTSLIAKYGVDSKAVIKSINNPFKMIDGGKQTLDFDVVLAALNLTANMTKTLSDFMQKNDKVMDAAKAKVAKEGKDKGWLTKYGTLNMNKFLQDADVAAALKTYAAENEENAAGVLKLKTAVAASTAADEAAGAALDPVVTDASSASTTAAGFVTVAAAVFMAL